MSTATLAGTSACRGSGFDAGSDAGSGDGSGAGSGAVASAGSGTAADLNVACSRACSTAGTGGSLGRREGVASGIALGGDGKGWKRFGCRIWCRDDPAGAARAGSVSAKDFFTDISTCSMLGPLS